MFPKEKYKYFDNGKDTVIAEQTFAGRKYRGKAVCDDLDKFDIEVGKDIASAKCDFKICSARTKYAKARLEYAQALLDFAMDEYERMSDYFHDASEEEIEALKRLTEVMHKNGVRV